MDGGECYTLSLSLFFFFLIPQCLLVEKLHADFHHSQANKYTEAVI